MSVQHANQGVVKKDLQLYYNREFSKSFRGEATTNLIGTYGVGAANAYPSAGNNWGTYRDSLYNSGVPASIGTIASVSVDNVITVSSPTSYFNSFATYDVIQPQSTGGGVTAGVNYYFKRLTSTTFTLHQYDGTDDASKTPEQVLTYINSDTKISVNGTSFPTVWWGYPHLPNVALIKTAITNGFAYDNRFHDCIRLNWFRSDRTDGMAYGVQPSYTANTQYTFSCYIRASSQAAIGNNIYFTLYFSGTATGAGGFSCPALTSGWQKWTQTFTTSGSPGIIYFYFWINHSSPSSVDIAEMQLDQKTYPTEFTPTSRSANTVAGGGGLLDISGNNVNADLTNVSFNSSGYFFNGSSNYIDLGSDVTFKTSGGWSVSSWFNLTQVNSGNLYNFIGASAITYNSWFWTVYQSNLALWNMSPGGWYYGSTTIQANTWYNAVLVCSYDGTKYQMYLNGVAEGGTHTSYTWNSDYSGLKVGYIGRGDSSNGRYFYGAYPDFKIYRKELTAAEVLQNFNATRKTYGI
jgi:hypothetical protein